MTKTTEQAEQPKRNLLTDFLIALWLLFVFGLYLYRFISDYWLANAYLWEALWR